MSGLFFRNSGDFLTLLRKKFNQLFVPLVFFYFLAVALSYGSVRLLSHNFLWAPLTFDGFLAKDTFPNVPMWFLQALLVDFILAYFITKASSRVIWQGSIVLIFAGIGNLLARIELVLPFHISTAFTCLPYFWIDYVCRNSSVLRPHKYDKFAFPVGLLMVIAGIVLYELSGNPRLTFWRNYIEGRWYVCYVVASLMVPGILFMCKSIKSLPLINYMGRHSIIVYGTHYVLIHILKGWFSMVHVFIIVTIICICLIPIIKTLFPYFCAQKELIPPMSRLGTFTRGIIAGVRR